VTSQSPPPPVISPPPPPVRSPPPNPSRDTSKCLCTCRTPENCNNNELRMENCVCTCDWNDEQCDACVP
jgi:hypothetical protein